MIFAEKIEPNFGEEETVALTITTNSEEETQSLGFKLASALAAGDIILLTGELGAGKTVFVKGLAKGLGVKQPVTSPTFTILHIYEGRLPLYHFDLFRLEKIDPLEFANYEEYLFGNGVAVVEWGEKIESLLTDYLIMSFHRELKNPHLRVIEAAGQGERGKKLVAQLNLLKVSL